MTTMTMPSHSVCLSVMSHPFRSMSVSLRETNPHRHEVRLGFVDEIISEGGRREALPKKLWVEQTKAHPGGCANVPNMYKDREPQCNTAS